MISWTSLWWDIHAQKFAITLTFECHRTGCLISNWYEGITTLRPMQYGRLLQMLFSTAFSSMKMSEFHYNVSLGPISKGSINTIPALIHMMAWHRPGNKPLAEPMMVGLLAHICVTQLQRVNIQSRAFNISRDLENYKTYFCSENEVQLCINIGRIPWTIYQNKLHCKRKYTLKYT